MIAILSVWEQCTSQPTCNLEVTTVGDCICNLVELHKVIRIWMPSSLLEKFGILDISQMLDLTTLTVYLFIFGLLEI